MSKADKIFFAIVTTRD